MPLPVWKIKYDMHEDNVHMSVSVACSYSKQVSAHTFPSSVTQSFSVRGFNASRVDWPRCSPLDKASLSVPDLSKLGKRRYMYPNMVKRTLICLTLSVCFRCFVTLPIASITWVKAWDTDAGSHPLHPTHREWSISILRRSMLRSFKADLLGGPLCF